MNGGSATWRANSRYRTPPCTVGLLVVGFTVAGRPNRAIISCGRMAKNWTGSRGYATTAGPIPGPRGRLRSRRCSNVQQTKPNQPATDARALDGPALGRGSPRRLPHAPRYPGVPPGSPPAAVVGAQCVALRERLPVLPVPLRAPDRDVLINLAAVFTTAYDRGRFDRRINYE